MGRSIGYARVSSLEQARDTGALDQQQQRLRDAGCTILFTDIQSGTRDDRPELQRAFKELRTGDTLIATRLDRLSRSPSYNEKILNHFDRDDAPGLWLLDDGLDLRTPSGRLTARLLSAVAAGEVERLSERVAHGRAARQAKGGHGAKPPWAFVRASDGLGLAVDPELKRIAKAFIERFIETASMRDALRWLHQTHKIVKPKSSMVRWMKNPALAGGIGRASGTKITAKDGTRKRIPPKPGVYTSIEWDSHEGLISRAQWTEIQRAFRIQAERSGSEQRVGAQRHWHTGRFRCGGCGKRAHRHFGQVRCDNSSCSQQYGNGSVNVDVARASLIRALEWLGVGIIERLAPMKAAMESKEATPPPAVLQLQSEIAALEPITGTAPLIQQKQIEIDRLMADVTGHQVTTLQAMEALDNPLRCPWELDDAELLQVLDDLELIADVSNKWVVRVESRRFGGVWTFDPDSVKESFTNDGKSFLVITGGEDRSDEDRRKEALQVIYTAKQFPELEKDFTPMWDMVSAEDLKLLPDWTLTRTDVWHETVRDETWRLEDLEKLHQAQQIKKQKKPK